ncbi:LysE family transporter [Alicyclobacillus sp.]|uniref:LysE family transporter n=1 Tax=Alicyclobacillus sp. TaxID=61169 RepID=UPI0025BDD6DB|nr:LysE family transporter [Alicyclobacillus sp.]MCL6515921.1 LysE family translocator [Alicyclobacillus sp.]
MGGEMAMACVLGFLYSAAPGAVNTEALRRGLQRGFLPSFLVQLGALLGDVVWAILGLSGVALVFHFLPVKVVLGFVGVTFLLRMAWLSFLDARRPIVLTGAAGVGDRRDFMTGLVFSLANPFGIAFWGGIGGGFATRAAEMPVVEKLLILLVGFSIGALIWCVGISMVVAWSRRFIGEWVLRGIFTLSSLAMLYFALEMLWTLWHTTLYPLFSQRVRFKDAIRWLAHFTRPAPEA